MPQLLNATSVQKERKMHGRTWRGGDCGAISTDALVLQLQPSTLQCEIHLIAADLLELQVWCASGMYILDDC